MAPDRPGLLFVIAAEPLPDPLEELDELTRELERLADRQAWGEVGQLVGRHWRACQGVVGGAGDGDPGARQTRLADIARRTRRVLESAQAERARLTERLSTARRETTALHAYLGAEGGPA